jgi:hypothetical protein
VRRIGRIGGESGYDEAGDARGVPVGVRLMVIVASGIIGWAIPLGILYLLW